jgi:pullulanase
MPKHPFARFDSAAFRRRFHYEGDDLGVMWAKAATSFRLWAPTAKAVVLHLYRRGHGGSPYASFFMRPDRNGTWVARFRGDLHGVYYTYQAMVDGTLLPEAVDPYAVAVGANGRRGMVIDLQRTHPAGWNKDRRVPCASPVDAVIYELHVRDFSVHPRSGLKNKGTYLAFTERGTKNRRGDPTGVDHLVRLGVSHVHLLPSFDHGSIDELSARPNYNWGYDPMNYNAPEGSYASDPRRGEVRVREFKQMVQGLHRAGIGVILDVVYNHTYKATDSNFNLLVPGYYYRQDENGGFANGSGCGNETASDRSMFRKFMVDSLVYWAREYHIDGFRFDLMGLHDIATMNEIRAALDRVDRRIILYGEGWTGGTSPLPEAKRASKANVAKLRGIAAFSDDIRDATKGPVWDKAQPGFANGHAERDESVKFGIVASTEHPQVRMKKVSYSRTPWAKEPWQTVTYASCHDNHTLWDKLALAGPKQSEAERIRIDKLVAAIVLTSQGIAFLHAGEEFLRTKKGHENSYNLPDAINRLDWDRRSRHRNVVDYYAGLVALRRSRAAFRLRSADAIRRRLTFLPAKRGVVAYVIEGIGREKTIAVAFNGTARPAVVSVGQAPWHVLVDDLSAGATPQRRIQGGRVALPPRSALVLEAAG